MNTPENPPCANWKIWTGPEVEGHTDLGKKTLFVREGLHFPLYMDATISRVWFCKEILDLLFAGEGLALLTSLKRVRPEVAFAFEIPLVDIDMYLPLRKFGKFYVKFDLGGYISPGDTLCFGQPYMDRFVLVEHTTTKVNHEDYSKDVCLEA